MKPTVHIFIKTALFCACCGFANALFGQTPPNLKVVLPLYGANKIELEWDHVPLATSYEFRRKVNAGSYGAWTPTSSLTSHTDDVPANTFDLYTYQVRAQVNGNWTNPSTERSNSFQKTWPVANSASCGSSSGSGVLNGFNQPILAGSSNYLHEGMDINGNAGVRSECVVAPLAGVVVSKGGNGNNTAVNLKVFLNGQSEYLQLNHLGGLLSNYKVGESVMPGQQLGFIMGDTSGWTVLSSHTHFHYWRNNALFWASTSDPHSVFDAPADKDPFQESPKVEDTNGDGKPLRFRHGPDKTTYFDGDSFFDDDDEIYQETDIVVEVVDRQSSNPPYVAPKQLGYFIEKLDGATWKNAVRNTSKPYLLTDNIFGFYQAASGLPANPNLPVTNAMSDRNPSLKSSAPATPSDYNWTQWWTYQVTNTTGTDGDPGNLDANQCWATDARNNVGTPNGYRANYDRARINDEAKFPDGKYRVNIRMADWVNTASDYQKEIFVNNFRPYVKQFDMEQVGVGAYSCAWDFDAGTGNLSPTVYETDEGAKFSRCKDIKMKITMSEPMKYVSIHIPGITTFSQSCTAVFGSDSKKWEFTIPKDWLEKLSSNIYNIEIEGKDKSDEDIQGFSDNLTPVSSANIPKHQQGDTWLPNIPAQKDKAHSFEITGEKVAAFALGGGIFTLCNSNPKVTLYSGASGGTEPYNFNWKGAGNSVEVSASGKYTATVEDKNGCKAEASVYVIVIPVVCGGSGDPNQILGPSGFDTPRWVSKNDVLAYHVDFENDPAIANAPAQRILVEVPFDPDFQLNTFKVGRFGFANLEFEVPENRTFYQTRVDATSTTGVLVDVSAGIDIVNQKLFWILQAVDPATGLPPTGAFMGLLPVNDTLTNNGQGFVEFTIKPGPATQTGDTVTAQASIFFDQNEVVPTNVWSNLIDALPPTSTLDALAPTQYSTFFPISFSGEDDAGGSGLDFFELFVSENGGSFERYGDRTSETINFIGNIGSTYEFFTLATDRTGNREATKTSGDTVHIEGMTATVVTQNPDCPGAASGSATINRTGGKAPFHYAWSAAGAGNTATVSGLAPGIYTASVSDSNFPPLLVELEFEISDTIELTPPTTLCQNLTQNLQASDTLAHFTAAAIAGGSTDNCGVVMFSPSTFSFGCGQLGPHIVTLTVADAVGNSATCSATLTVTDANGLCNPDADGDGYSLSNDCDDGNADIHPGIAENCGLVGMPGVDDDCDGTIDEDLTPPTITCPASQALKTGDDGGADCEVMVTYSAPTFSDNCDGTGTATWVSGPTSGTSLHVGGSPYTVVYTKTDAAGNTVGTNCSFTVTVQDDTKPTLANCPSNILLKTGDDGGADCEVTVTYTAPTFSDNCDGTGPATWVSGPTSGTSLHVGGSPYTVVYTKTDAAGNTVATNCSFTVTVQDDTKPTLANCPSNILLKTGDDGGADCEVMVTYTAPTFSDNCDGTGTATWVSGPTSGTSLNVSGSPYTVVYTKTDAAGNTVATNCSFTVTVQDDTKPTLANCPSNILLKTGDDGGADCEVMVTYTAPTFSDNCDGIGTASWVSGPTSGTSLNVSGSPYTVVYTKTDAAGNTVATNCSFTVTVQDDTKPTLANCPSNILLKTSDDGGADCEVMVTYTAPTFSDNCDGTGTATWVSGPTSGTSLNVSGSPYTVVYTKTDAAGNTVATNCSFTVTVQDDTKPTLANCPSNILLKTGDDGGADCEVMVTYTAPTFSDNCDGIGTASWVSGPTSGTSLNVSGSPYTVVYTKTDAAGNTVATNCSFTVTVQDDTKPTLANPLVDCSSLNITGVNKCLNTATAFNAMTLESAVAALYKDNCTVPTATLTSTTPGDGNTNCSWNFTYTYTISDGIPANNVTCTVTRSGSDQTIPVITLTGSSTVEICQYATYTDAGATAMDNCGGNITANIVPNNPVNTAVPNTYTVTYNVTDACTNAAIQVTRTVIVKPTPTASVTGNVLVCIGASIPLNGNPVGGFGTYSTHTWSQTGGAGAVSITNNNDGSASILGITAGSVTLQYTVTDDKTCSGTAMYNITVVDCGGIAIINNRQPGDPCSCNNDQSANGAQDGTFGESVSVLPTTNQETWTVVAVGRLAASGGLPTGIAIGNTLTYNAGGFHEISFQHVDDAGYTMVVEGPNSTVGTPGNPAIGNSQLTVSNICQYPVIAFDPTLPANVYMSSTPIALTVSEANSFVGVTTYTVNGNAATHFDPSPPLTPPGPYPVVANYTGTFAGNSSLNPAAPAFPGCMTSIADQIGIYTAPTVSCPGPVNLTTNSDDNGDCDAEYLLTHPDIGTMYATDLVISFTNGAPAPPYLPSGGSVTPSGFDTYAFAAGQTIVTYTATDPDNNVTSCFFTVTVVDNEDPTISCPGPTTVQCTSLVPAPSPASVGASDNCGIILKEHWYTTLPYNMQCLNKFQLTRYYRVYDAEGNSATCSQVITVFDDVKPMFTFVPANVTVQCNSVPAVGNPTANDNCNGTVQIVYNGQSNVNGSCTDGYVLTRQWTATDACGNTRTATQSITVIDTQKPAFVTVPANVTVQCDAIPAVASPTATDNCDASVVISYIGQTKTNGACANSFTYTRRWVASDNCNNTVSISQRIVVVDNGKPAITVPANVTIACTDPVPAVGAPSATDNCGGTVTIVYLGQSTINATCPGNYQIRRTWRATDVCGNSTVATQTIQVTDSQVPTFTTFPADATIQCNQSPPALTNPVATDNCGGYVSITYLGQVRTNGNCLYNYTLTRTWRAADLCGNSTTRAQVITVQDTQAPNFTNPPADVTVVCAPDFVPPPVTPNATDNCGTPTVTLVQTQSPGDCSTGYTVTRTWTATDQCGTPKVHVQTFTVLPTPFAPPAADRDQEQRNTLVTRVGANLKTVSLLPNPTTDWVGIGLGDFAGEDVMVSIHDELGRLVWEQHIPTVEESVLRVSLRQSGALAGLYAVSVRSGAQVYAKRLVLLE